MKKVYKKNPIKFKQSPLLLLNSLLAHFVFTLHNNFTLKKTKLLQGDIELCVTASLEELLLNR
jgi:hypothetical protein